MFLVRGRGILISGQIASFFFVQYLERVNYQMVIVTNLTSGSLSCIEDIALDLTARAGRIAGAKAFRSRRTDMF